MDNVDVIAVGERGSGKTSFLRQLCTGEFFSWEEPTVGIGCFRTRLRVAETMDLTSPEEGEKPDTSIVCWDASGAEEYMPLAKKHVPQSSLVCLVVSALDAEGLDHLQKWLRLSEDADAKNFVVLISHADKPKEEWKLDKKAAEEFCHDIGALGCCYVSALDRDTVCETFCAILRKLKQVQESGIRKKKKNKKKNKKSEGQIETFDACINDDDENDRERERLLPILHKTSPRKYKERKSSKNCCGCCSQCCSIQ